LATVGFEFPEVETSMENGTLSGKVSNLSQLVPTKDMHTASTTTNALITLFIFLSYLKFKR
jgi:hypothetical protein